MEKERLTYSTPEIQEILDSVKDKADIKDVEDKLANIDKGAFWAEYGKTTPEEIRAALDARQVILCRWGQLIFWLVRENSTNVDGVYTTVYTFTHIGTNNACRLVILNGTTWQTESQIFAVQNSPQLTGTPTAPTAEAGTNTKQIATTAFVQAALNSVAIPDEQIEEKVKEAVEEIVGPGFQAIDLSVYPEQNCSLGANAWYNAGKQKHIAIPVKPGEKLRIQLSEYDSLASGDYGGYYVFVDSSYSNSTPSNNMKFPSVNLEGRYTADLGDLVELTVPENAAYLILTTCDGAGKQCLWKVWAESDSTVVGQIGLLKETCGSLQGSVKSMEAILSGDLSAIDGWRLTTTSTYVRVYCFAVTRATAGGVLTVKLSNYNKYTLGVAVLETAEWAGKTITDTGWRQSDIIKTFTREESGYFIKIAIARADNSSMELSDVDAASPEILYDSPSTSGLVGQVGKLADMIGEPATRIPMNTTGSSTYLGTKIDLSDHVFTSDLIGNLSGASTFRQGFAIFGDYLFQCHHTNNAVKVFKLSTAENVQSIALAANANNHANSAGFGAQYYDPSDPFPILYIDSQGENKLYAYRITGTEGNFTMDLVQTISMPGVCHYQSSYIDAPNHRAVVVGYAKDSWNDAADNKMVCLTYDLPDPTSGDFAVKDLANEWRFPFVYATQGGFAMYGKLFLAFGNTSEGLKIGGILVIDYIQRNVETFVDLKAVGDLEPEGVGKWNDSLVITTQAGEVYKLSFQ